MSSAAAPADGQEANSSSVEALAALECCARRCLAADATPRADLEALAASLAAMTKRERKVCLFTALSLSSLVGSRPAARPGTASSSSGASAAAPAADAPNSRRRFAYYLPIVGEVCREAFMAAFGVSTCSLNRYRRVVHEDKRLVAAPHGNAHNRNAKVLDDELLADWLRRFARERGQVVTQRVRVRKQEHGQRKSAMVEQTHTLLPPDFTWERLLREFETNAACSEAQREMRPSLSSFRRILTNKCPDIKLQSGRKPPHE